MKKNFKKDTEKINQDKNQLIIAFQENATGTGTYILKDKFNQEFCKAVTFFASMINVVKILILKKSGDMNQESNTLLNQKSLNIVL